MTEWSLHPKIMTRIFGTWGTPTVDISNTGDRCSVTGLAGAVDVHVSKIPLAQQSHSVTRSHPGWRDDFNSPLMAITTVVTTPTSSVYVDHPHIIPYRRHVLSQPGYVLDGKLYYLHAWRLSCSTTKQQDFQKRSLGSQQHQIRALHKQNV